jgi:hypothetical protein
MFSSCDTQTDGAILVGNQHGCQSNEQNNLTVVNHYVVTATLYVLLT